MRRSRINVLVISHSREETGRKKVRRQVTLCYSQKSDAGRLNMSFFFSPGLQAHKEDIYVQRVSPPRCVS